MWWVSGPRRKAPAARGIGRAAMVKLKDIMFRPASPVKENTDHGVGLVLTPGPDSGAAILTSSF